MDDPVVNDDVGVYSDDRLTEIYKELWFWGMKSKKDALLVGIFIEEFDSIDLELAMAATDVEAINQVYDNLCEGSYNHLESFIYALEHQTDDEYLQSILTEALTIAINDIKEDIGDPKAEVAISLLTIHSDEKIESFLDDMTDEPGVYKEGNTKSKNQVWPLTPSFCDL